MKKYIKNRFLRNIVNFPRNFCRTINACVLCIRFPFLYPRNRFNDLHYNNWKFRTKLDILYKESQKCTYTHPNEPEYKEDFIWVTIILDSKKLFWYKVLDWIYRNPMQWIHAIPTYTELDDMPDGWRKAFGIKMCKEIKTELKKHNYLRKYRITQIKEKFGGLRWYDAGAPQSIYDIISKYGNISRTMCINCGKSATCVSAGWISPYCDDCKSPDVRQNYVSLEEENAWDKAYTFYWPKNKEE